MGPIRIVGQSRPLGKPRPYFVSLDLPTARHWQTLLATHLDGKPLTVEHGAPLRLVAPVKLGVKNVKACADYLYKGRTSGPLGKARVFTLRRDLNSILVRPAESYEPPCVLN